jgi:Uma2 family endonuclease
MKERKEEPMTEPLRRLFTTSEYHTMLDSGILHEEDRVELIEGEIWQMTPIGSGHVACVGRADKLLQRGLGDRATIFVQSPVHLDDFSEPEPDVAVLHFREDFYADALATPPDIFFLIEVADATLQYDRRIKVGLYARSGIPEVWLVNLPESTIEVYRDPSPQGYRDVQILGRGDLLSPLAFPDLALDVSSILG